MDYAQTTEVDVESLFETAAKGGVSVPPATTPAPARESATATQASAKDAYEVFHRIGQITRRLHDALRELGYDHQIENAVHSLPDARTRLDYIARLTGAAADKVLNTVDIAQQVQNRIDEHAKLVRAKVAAHPDSPLAEDIKGFLDDCEVASASQREHLTEIMLAQDFHDLTGQVIRKIVDLASSLEEQLVKLLLEATPLEQRVKVDSTGLSGPVVDAAGRTDVVTNQAQVDDLLDSLGF
jgi:chemotaxis protein CheZ